MAFKYRYTYRLGADGVLLRMPIVRVLFTNPKNKKQIEVGCLIDSGADDIFLNTRLAEALGVDITKGATKEYQGITSTPVVASEQFLSMNVEPDTHQFNVACSFLPDLPVFGLLGQNGFFDNYKVVFKRYENQFELTPVDEK
jgi:hypothetical protein